MRVYTCHSRARCPFAAAPGFQQSGRSPRSHPACTAAVRSPSAAFAAGRSPACRVDGAVSSPASHLH